MKPTLEPPGVPQAIPDQTDGSCYVLHKTVRHKTAVRQTSWRRREQGTRTTESLWTDTFDYSLHCNTFSQES